MSSSPLQAASISFTGQFGTDDQVQVFAFSIAADTTVTLRSLAYGGGTNAALDLIPAGGFDSLFTIFTQSGVQVGVFDDDPGCANTNTNNGVCLDAFYQAPLAAGSYILALTQSGNFPNGDLADGFGQQGSGNFTCPQGFCDTFGNQNNGSWAVDIAGVDAAASVPEPGTGALACALLTLGALWRRRLLRA